MPCVFCGASGLTKEHIFAGWIAKLYPSENVGTGVIIAPDGATKTYAMPPFNQTVRVVCAGCNNGWMSELEEKAAPLLRRMIKAGQAKRMSAEDQQLAATWSVKTAFMLQCIHPADRVVPESEYRRFYDTKLPPVGLVVWLAARGGLRDHTGHELVVASREQAIDRINVEDPALEEKARREVAEGRRLYRLTFTVGRLVFQVFGHDFPAQFKIATPGQKQFRQWIWPLQEEITWPPPVMIEAIGGIDGFHASLQPPPSS